MRITILKIFALNEAWLLNNEPTHAEGVYYSSTEHFLSLQYCFFYRGLKRMCFFLVPITMCDKKHEQQINVKFLVKLKENLTECYKLLKTPTVRILYLKLGLHLNEHRTRMRHVKTMRTFDVVYSYIFRHLPRQQTDPVPGCSFISANKFAAFFRCQYITECKKMNHLCLHLNVSYVNFL